MRKFLMIALNTVALLGLASMAFAAYFIPRKVPI